MALAHPSRLLPPAARPAGRRRQTASSCLCVGVAGWCAIAGMRARSRVGSKATSSCARLRRLQQSSSEVVAWSGVQSSSDLTLCMPALTSSSGTGQSHPFSLLPCKLRFGSGKACLIQKRLVACGLHAMVLVFNLPVCCNEVKRICRGEAHLPRHCTFLLCNAALHNVSDLCHNHARVQQVGHPGDCACVCARAYVHQVASCFQHDVESAYCVVCA